MKKIKESPGASKSAEELVEHVVASLNIEGVRVPEDEKDILRRIASGELNADEVAEAIAKQALEKSRT